MDPESLLLPLKAFSSHHCFKPSSVIFTSHSPPCSLWSDWFQRSSSLMGHRERLHALFKSELCCSCVCVCVCVCLNGISLLCNTSHKNAAVCCCGWDWVIHIFAPYLCVSVCEDMPIKHGFILYCQIFDFITHVDVSDSVIVLAQPWVQHLGCSDGCLFVPPGFVFSFYLNVTASWSAKTNLCLCDFCERCIQCFVNAVFFPFIHICHTDNRPLFELFHDCNKRSAFIPAWC